MKKKLVSILSSAALLGMLAGTTMAATPFSDVPANSPYASYIADLSSKNIVSGVGNGQFAPTKTLTRAEMATFLVRAFGIPQNTSTSVAFTDVRGHWAESYIKAAYAAGMIAGKSATTFAPDATVTREEAAQMVWNYLSKHGVQSTSGVYNLPMIGKLDNWAQSAVVNLMAHQLVGPSNFSDWTAPMNRQEAAALIDLAMQALAQKSKPVSPLPPTPAPAPASSGGAGNPDVSSVQKQGNVYNPTNDTTTNLAKNSDGTYSPGNIRMDSSFQEGISSSDFDYNMKLIGLIKVSLVGQNVTVTVPNTGKSGLNWNVAGLSMINGKGIPSSTPVFNGNGPKTLTFQSVTNVAVSLIDGPKVRGGVAFIFQNGHWVVKYPIFN